MYSYDESSKNRQAQRDNQRRYIGKDETALSVPEFARVVSARSDGLRSEKAWTLESLEAKSIGGW